MSLSFENPHAFWLLLLLPVFLVLKVLADGRARRAVSRLAAPRLLDGLILRTGKAVAWVVLSLELLGLAFFTAALAQPQYGSVSEEVQSSGRNLIIAMDVSKSMLAVDVKPNRLERAKFAAMDLVKRLNRDRVALIQFAGSANVLCPFTVDADAVQEFIESLDTESVALGGSNLAKAILYSIDTFKQSDLTGQQAMVIFSDGEELQGEALAAASKAREANISIICVAVGTAAGGYIDDPESPSGIFRDRDNRPVITKLHKEVLMRIADITRGLYLALDGRGGVNDSRLDLILQKLQRSDMKSKTIETKVDRYRWPLAAGLLSFVAAFLTGIVRRHRAGVPGTAVTTLTAALLLLVNPPSARGEKAPGQTGEKPAAAENPAPPPPPVEEPKPGDPRKFYNEGDWKNAAFNFRRMAEKAHTDQEIDEMQMGRGVACFKAAVTNPKKFDNTMIAESMAAFGVALASDDMTVRETAHYDLAGAIFERAKAADAAREEALKKAKTGDEKKPYELTIEYLDSLIRQLENCMEHYQDTLTLNSDNVAAKKNLDAVSRFVDKLRDIRKAKAKQGQGKSKGEGEGDGEGDGKGNGKGKGKGPPGDGGEGKGKDEAGKTGGNSEEDDKSGASDKSNKDFKEKLSPGEGKNPGKEPKDAQSGGQKYWTDELTREDALQTLDNLSGKLPTRGRKLTPPTSTGKNW